MKTFTYLSIIFFLLTVISATYLHPVVTTILSAATLISVSCIIIKAQIR